MRDDACAYLKALKSVANRFSSTFDVAAGVGSLDSTLLYSAFVAAAADTVAADVTALLATWSSAGSSSAAKKISRMRQGENFAFLPAG